MGGAVRRSEQDVRGSRGRIRALNFRVAGLFTRVRGSGILGSSGLLGQEAGRSLPTHQACPPEEPSSSVSSPPGRPRNCTLSATTSTLLLLDPSWASQVRYCNLPSTKMGSPFFLYVAIVSPSSRHALMSKKSTSSFLERTRFTAMPKEHTGTPA